MKARPTALHKQVKKFSVMLKLEETRTFFQSVPKAVITAGNCPKALLLYILQHAQGEAAALQTSKQCPGTGICNLDHWITGYLTSSQWERQNSSQKPDSAGFKSTNRTAGDYLSPENIPGSLVTVEVPHPMLALQQARGFLRAGGWLCRSGIFSLLFLLPTVGKNTFIFILLQNDFFLPEDQGQGKRCPMCIEGKDPENSCLWG